MFQLNIVFYIFIIVVIIMGIVTFIKNERSPIISTKAQLVYKKREYHTHTNIPEYQWGNLIFQGTRFLKFELNNSIV